MYIETSSSSHFQQRDFLAQQKGIIQNEENRCKEKTEAIRLHNVNEIIAFFRMDRTAAFVAWCHARPCPNQATKAAVVSILKNAMISLTIWIRRNPRGRVRVDITLIMYNTINIGYLNVLFGFTKPCRQIGHSLLKIELQAFF